MKKMFFSLVVLFSIGSMAASKQLISGSDTMAGLMTDAIVASGMNQVIGYVGGGSGVGEKALVAGEIGITAMSRPLKPEAEAALANQNVSAVVHVIALDGLSIFVNKSNPLVGMDFTTLAKIFSCEFTSWNQIPGSGKTGAIKAFRRNDESGTTDTFKNVVGIKKFGDCVTVVNETVDISEHTASNTDAIGYAGESAHKDGNKSLAISKAGTQFVKPTTATIRDGSYPLSRKLYIYEVSGARIPSEVEKALLDQVLDRSFMDPIVQDHEFITVD